jgi:hypothetical protein
VPSLYHQRICVSSVTLHSILPSIAQHSSPILGPLFKPVTPAPCTITASCMWFSHFASQFTHTNRNKSNYPPKKVTSTHDDPSMYGCSTGRQNQKTSKKKYSIHNLGRGETSIAVVCIWDRLKKLEWTPRLYARGQRDGDFSEEREGMTSELAQASIMGYVD